MVVKWVFGLFCCHPLCVMFAEKMKRVNIILIALFLLLSAGQLWAQQDRAIWVHSMSELPYRSWATFAGDTAAYLEFNFTIRSTQYIGWTVGEFLDKLELPVIGIVSNIMSSSRPSSLIALTFGIRQIGSIHSPLRDYYILVRFENPPISDEFLKVSPVGNTTITPEVYNFIRDLRIAGVSSNPYILRDPELSERRRRQVEESERRGREAREFLDRLDRAGSEAERERLREQERARQLERQRQYERERERQREWRQERARENRSRLENRSR